MVETGPPEARTAWLALGANLGRRNEALAALRGALRRNGVLLIVEASPILCTTAVGLVNQPDFHNQVLRVEATTPLHPLAWLRRCREAETAAGRRPTWRWGPRRADVDILLFGDRGELSVRLPELTVPHPEISRRPFLCAQLAWLEPGLTHPDGWRFADRAGQFTEVAHPRPRG